MNISLKHGLLCPILLIPDAKKLKNALEIVNTIKSLSPIDAKISSAAEESSRCLKILLDLCAKDHAESPLPLLDGIEEN